MNLKYFIATMKNITYANQTTYKNRNKHSAEFILHLYLKNNNIRYDEYTELEYENTIKQIQYSIMELVDLDFTDIENGFISYTNKNNIKTTINKNEFYM